MLSIESQIRELEAVASRLGLKVDEILRESMSAKAPGRPVFNKLMERAESGEIAGILCWKLDRLARNPVDGGRIIWSIKNSGLRIVTSGQTYSPEDDNTILMYVEFGMAQKYIDDLGKNVKRGNHAKLEQGWLPGVAPIGYINKLDDHTIIPDPERFQLVRKMWELYMAANSVEKIVKIADGEWGFRTFKRKRRGGGRLAKSSLYRILTSPFYYGLIDRFDRGEKRHYRGSHEPMITEEEFWRVQRMLGRPSPRSQKKHFAYTGLIRCADCGFMVTAEEKTKKSGLVYTYYHCSRRSRDVACKNQAVTLAELEGQVSALLEQVRIPEAFKDWALKWLSAAHETEAENRSTVLSSLQNAYAENQRKIDCLTDMRLKEMLTDEEYGAKKTALLSEQQSLKEKLGDTDQRSANWLERTEQSFDFAVTAKSRFESGSLDDKRHILASLGTQMTLHDKQLRLELHDLWKCFANHSKQLFEDVERLELANSDEDNKEPIAFETMSSMWRAGRDSNPRPSP